MPFLFCLLNSCILNSYRTSRNTAGDTSFEQERYIYGIPVNCTCLKNVKFWKEKKKAVNLSFYSGVYCFSLMIFQFIRIFLFLPIKQYSFRLRWYEGILSGISVFWSFCQPLGMFMGIFPIPLVKEAGILYYQLQNVYIFLSSLSEWNSNFTFLKIHLPLISL